MPFGDGTGPAGYGPLTGKRMGYCSDFSDATFRYPVFRRDIAYRCGYGRGYRHMHYDAVHGRSALSYGSSPYNSGLDHEDQLEFLKNAARNLEIELEQIRKKLDELGDSEER